jgi:hypothetical protein
LGATTALAADFSGDGAVDFAVDFLGAMGLAPGAKKMAS